MHRNGASQACREPLRPVRLGVGSGLQNQAPPTFRCQQNRCFWSITVRSHSGLLTAMERPVIVPLLHLTIWLSPLLWLSNLMSYLNGSALLSTKSSGFAGTETWEELDFVARFQLQAAPAVMARGMLGMLRYDASGTLKAINVPALVLAGDRDPVCKPEASERMGREIPDAQLAKLAPAKHMGLIEHHTRFAEIVSNFSSLCCQPIASNSPFDT